MKRIAVIGAILEKPEVCQAEFNEVVSDFKGLVKGRMGLPFDKAEMAVISLTVTGTVDEINTLNGKLGRIPNVTVKTAISNAEIAE